MIGQRACIALLEIGVLLNISIDDNRDIKNIYDNIVTWSQLIKSQHY